MALSLDEHPLRESLVLEMHSRPFQSVGAPEKISHLAMLTGEGGVEANRAHLGVLCARYDVPPPPGGATHFAADLGAFRVKWEQHTEFCTYTFFRAESFEHPFENPVIDLVPGDWLSGVAGEVLAAVHLAVEPRDAQARTPEEIARLFSGNTVFGSRVAGDSAILWTDLRLQADRFTRILVRDQSMSERQAGRLIQRLVEISSYRMMALLGLPVARKAGPDIRRIDKAIAGVAGRMADDDGPSGDSKRLAELAGLAAEIESIAAATAYRFEASAAYYTLVKQRLHDLRENRIEGLQTYAEFLERRMAPAMATCESTHARQQALSRRAARAAALLRARVQVAQEEQNQALLESMNRRAQLQLRLQETVEGLSVVAISYYLVGLVGYGLKGLAKGGLPVNPDIGTGIAMPLVLAVVWYGLKKAKKALHRDAG